MRRHRITADVALLKFAEPVSSAPVPLGPAGLKVAPGDPFLVAGYGLATPGDGRSGGTVRTATLVATGQPGTLQIRLMDPATKNERAGLGACVGDSGGPVFTNSGGALAVIGVVSWSTGPEERGRLRRPHRRDTADALSGLDRRTGEANGIAARALKIHPPRITRRLRARINESIPVRHSSVSARHSNRWSRDCNGPRKRAADGGRVSFCNR